MLPRTIRYVLPVLLAVCHLTLAFPTQTPYAYDEVRSLQVNIPQAGPASAPLGSSISIPCLVSLSSTPTTPSSSPIVPRVKWAVVSGGVETQILVARGQRVKVNEAYRDRAGLLNYTSFPDDLSLWLADLRPSDSGHYRCEVQQGLEDASDVVQLKVKGVVFHYRDALGRYAFSFHQAQRACEAIGAEIATADQLLAAYYDGYEQCDAGWLADQSVRYPIQVPREGCYGDMDGQPGVRNYGTMDQDDLFDVYCYVEQIHGEVFHDFIPQQLSFDEAQSYCRAAGAEVATTAQLYLAWSEGLDRCSPGWLSDGSVRYPIITPRERCGGPQAGVKTLYRFSNQTGFPEPSSLHDVYCFKDHGNGPTVDYVATESEDIGQNVVILTDTDLELQLNQHVEQVEREAQSALESFPFVSQLSTEENLLDINPTVTTEATESTLNATSPLDNLQPFNESSYPTEMSSHSVHPTALINSTITGKETYDVLQNSSSPPSVYNETYSYMSLNFTFPQAEPESTTAFFEVSYEPYTHNQTVSDTNPEEHAHPSEGPGDSGEISEDNLDLNRSQANFSETDPIGGENILQTTPLTSGSMLQVKLEEAADAGTGQMSLWTASPREEEDLHTLATEDVIKNQTSLWLPPDGSGDNSQESNLDVDAVTFTASSVSPTSGFTTLPSPSASASTTSGERWTSFPHPASSSGSPNTDNLGFDILSTAAQLWESPISKQEGSTSLESEDTVTLESEEKQLHLTNPAENLVSGTKLSTAESSEGSVTSQVPTGSTTAQYQTSAYKVYWDTATIASEEASGQDPVTGTGILEEDVKFTQTLEDEIQVFPTTEQEQEDKVSPTPEEDMTVTPTLEDEANIYPALEEEAEVSFSLEKESEEEANVATTLEDETTIAPTLEYATVAPVLDEVNVSPTLTEEANITPTLEERAEVAPVVDEVDVSPTLTEEANITPTLEERAEVAPVVDEVDVSPTLTEEANITPTLEERAEVAPVVDEVDVSPTLTEEASITPTLEERAEVAPVVDEVDVSSTLTEEASITPTLEEGVEAAPVLEDADAGPTPEEPYVAPTLEDKDNVSLPVEEDANIVFALEEESNFASSKIAPSVEDITILPLDSQTSGWVLPTTRGPQKSFIDPEKSRKTSPISTAAPHSSSSTSPTRATTETSTTTITTTTHWSRRTWSPITPKPRVFHKTTESQKVTHLIPPVDQGAVDIEFSITQPPTLLILPNERAAVGGTGKASDACENDPCLNGGTCTDQDGQIKCLCLPTYGGFFCQTDLERCEPGWDKFHGFCYRHFSQRLSWEVAEQRCRMQGAHLVSIMTPEEQSYINSNYKEYQWTGLNDKTIEDDFRWSDGNPLLYENWYRGQPDSYFLSGEDCVVMVWHDDGRWSDVPCNYHLAYTCKKGTTSCGPPPKVRNAFIFGKARQRYETNAVIRYHCAEGFQQRLNPLIRCLSGGTWERPQIMCIPVAGGPTLQPDVTSPTNDMAAVENEFEATKEMPQYWDIRF